MTTELQARVIVLQLTDALLTQLRPFMAGLDTTANADSGGCPHIPRDPDGDLRARLLQGLCTHRSRHLLGAFPAAS